MIDPFVADPIVVVLRAEGYGLQLLLGPLIYERTLLSVERPSISIGLDEVLVDLRADVLEKVAEVPDNGEIPTDGMFSLKEIDVADDVEGGEAG